MTGEIVNIYQLTGSGPTYNEATAIRFASADVFNSGLAYPCKVPPNGISTYYSYWITLCLGYSGDYSLINNARFWGPGNIKASWFGTSYGRMIVGRMDTGDHGFAVASYQQAGGTPGTTGAGLKAAAPNGHAQYRDRTATVLDVDTLSEASPLVFDSRSITSDGYSKAFCIQTEAYAGASHGEFSPIELVLAVDCV